MQRIIEDEEGTEIIVEEEEEEEIVTEAYEDERAQAITKQSPPKNAIPVRASPPLVNSGWITAEKAPVES